MRARDVALALTPPEGTSIQNIFPAEVRDLAGDQGPLVDVLLVRAASLDPDAAQPLLREARDALEARGTAELRDHYLARSRTGAAP